MKNFALLIIIALLFFNKSYSQINANSVLGIPTATLADIIAVTDAQEGAFAYATDTDKLYTFNGTNWNEVTNNP